MHIELLVEEPSAEAAMTQLLPRILGSNISFRVHPHQGKPDILRALPKKLRGYAKWLPSDGRVAVLVDLDRDDCNQLKKRLERAARDAGLSTSTSKKGRIGFQVLNRIAIEELEAWFFGDVDALLAAFPRVPSTLASKASFRNPDAIKGGTWERLEQELQKAGYFKGGMPKIATAREVARHMQPDRNRSRSFAAFCQGLRSLVGQDTGRS
jgi:acylphosphatase